MATSVTNFADDELLIVVENSAGNKERRPLTKLHRTPPGAKVLGVISRAENPIRGHDHGWDLGADTDNFIYDVSSGFLGLLFTDLDLHSVSPTATSTAPIYVKAQEGVFAAIGVQEDTPGNTWGVTVANPPSVNERGLKEVRLENDFNPARPSNVYRYVRTGRFFTVRIYLEELGTFTSFEMSQLRFRVRQALAAWNNFAYPPSTPLDHMLKLAVEFVPELPDWKVKLHRTFPRENSRNWNINSTFQTLAHELGHNFGLVDEYPLALAEGIYKGLSGQALVQNGYLIEQNQFPMRAAERRGVACTKPPNLMESPHTAMPRVDMSLIESIRLGTQQKLCCRNNDFFCS